MLESLVPLMGIGIVALLVPRRWIASLAGQRLVAAALAVLVARYLWWRFTVTVLPARDLDPGSLFVWSLFAVEMLAWCDAAIGFLALLRRRADRSGEADVHEARLRDARPEDLPAVDVFIATYNEPLEVLEKTIVGALALDWPSERLRIHVLDDGKRDWLRTFCREAGASYRTRSDNRHAKAGNLNAAIAATDAPFFLVLDADFVPQQNFLYRAMGFFDDPRVGIVQVPHHFFNSDPMQTSLGMQRVLPNDQRFFFDVVMPGRDSWDCAFCCGSNSITRRTAIDAVGGGLPTESVTEDMLLTLALLRKGYVTRYLPERLAIGLAPESLSAFFVQRSRWARGAIQIMHLRQGPFGPGLGPIQRLMFLPTHWLTQSLSQSAAMATPAIYLLTGMVPLLNANLETVIHYQVPALAGTILAMRMFAPAQYFPLASTVLSVLQAFRLLPAILVTLVKPRGHTFKVTPKGLTAAGLAEEDLPTIVIASGLMMATAVGLVMNSTFSYRIISSEALVPVVTFWSLFNVLVLSIVCKVAVSPPRLRTEERFAVEEPCRILATDGMTWATVLDLSLSGALVETSPLADESVETWEVGDWRVLELAEVGPIAACLQRIARGSDGQVRLGLGFHLPRSPARDALIRKIFTQNADETVPVPGALSITLRMVRRVLARDRVDHRPVAAVAAPPAWVIELLRKRNGALVTCPASAA